MGVASQLVTTLPAVFGGGPLGEEFPPSQLSVDRIFGPSKLPGTTPSESEPREVRSFSISQTIRLLSRDESEDLGELDAATELCQA